jgi:hypothetical protein
MFLKRLTTSDTLSQPPVEIPSLVEATCLRTPAGFADDVEKKAWDEYEKNREVDKVDDKVDDNVTDVEDDEDERVHDYADDDDDCNYNEYVYVLTIDNDPCYYFKYKSRALKYMRRRARELCLLPYTGTGFAMTYKLVRHHSEDSLDVIKRLNNVLISYDQVICSFRIKRVYKKNTL